MAQAVIRSIGLCGYIWMIFLIKQVSATTLYVHPHANVDGSCPGTTCYEFRTYIQNASKYFNSNTTLVFLPGTHILDKDHIFNLQNLSNIRLVGSDDCLFNQRTLASDAEEYGFNPNDQDSAIFYSESTARVVCDNSSSMSFVNVANLTVSNITILNCGSTVKSANGTYRNVSVYMENITDLTMHGVSVRNSSGYGLLVAGLYGQSQIRHSSFVGNNQYVRRYLKQTVSDSKCPDNQQDVYLGTSSDGGNVLLVYTDDPIISSSGLSISDCVVALGVDGISNADSSGTGLSVKALCHASTNLVIKNTISHRNQAGKGANFFFDLGESNNFTLFLTSVRSTYGVGSNSGLFYSIVAQGNLTVSDSVFECDSVRSDTSAAVYISESQFHFDSCVFQGSDLSLNSAAFLQGSIAQSNFDTSSVTASGYNQDSDQCLGGTDFSHGDMGLSVISSSFKSSQLSAIRSVITLSGNLQLFDLVTDRYGSITSTCSTIVVNDGSSVVLSNNTAFQGGAVFIRNSAVVLGTRSSMKFVDNNAIYGGAVYVVNSTVFTGTGSDLAFIANSADSSGGALYFGQEASMHFASSTTLSLVNNTATQGGGIYVEVYRTLSSGVSDCFLRFDGALPASIGLIFQDNNASSAGSLLYVEDSIRCTDSILRFISFQDKSRYATTSLVTSQPWDVCPCEEGMPLASQGLSEIFLYGITRAGGRPACTSTSVTKMIYPGQKIFVPFVTYGVLRGTSPGIVYNYNNSSKGGVVSVINSDVTSCTTYEVPLQYGPSSSSTVHYIKTKNFQFGVDASNFDGSVILINVQIKPCPPGFVGGTKCVCAPWLDKFGVSCNIDNVSITAENMWIGFVINESGYDIGLAKECPFGYCKSDNKMINVEDFNDQCALNRTGTLCGRCQDGLSLVFGSSQCKKCDDRYLSLIVIFAFMGIFFVAVLFGLNATVSGGTKNGLVYFANIVAVSDNLFFSRLNQDDRRLFGNFFFAYVSWLNMDFGIETCFYQSMDSISKTWLNFVFSGYLILMVILIIIGSKYSSKISKLCQRNALPVLSTLILVSFSKITSTIITILSFTTIYTESGFHYVWKYDGSIAYGQGRHTALLIFGLLTMVLVLLFIVSLTCPLLLISKCHMKVVKILKPYLDCYSAPYKDRYLFWPGMLLFIRLGLYVLFTVNDSSAEVNLLIIVIVEYFYAVSLVALSVYKRLYNLGLEVYFHCLLMCLAVSNLVAYSLEEKESKVFYATTFILVGLAVFLGSVFIIILHLYWIFRKDKKKHI